MCYADFIFQSCSRFSEECQNEDNVLTHPLNSQFNFNTQEKRCPDQMQPEHKKLDHAARHDLVIIIQFFIHEL